MNRISNLFKSKATKEKEAQKKKDDNEKAENDRRARQESREFGKRIQANADIQTLEQSGSYTKAQIDYYKTPAKWDDLNTLAVMLRRSATDRKAMEKQKQTADLLQSIEDKKTEYKRQVGVSLRYLRKVPVPHRTIVPSTWTDQNIISHADLVYKMRKIKDEINEIDNEWYLDMVPIPPTIRKGGKSRQNKHKSRKTRTGKTRRKRTKGGKRRNKLTKRNSHKRRDTKRRRR